LPSSEMGSVKTAAMAIRKAAPMSQKRTARQAMLNGLGGPDSGSGKANKQAHSERQAMRHDHAHHLNAKREPLAPSNRFDFNIAATACAANRVSGPKAIRAQPH
jgi:hypothetical protein